MEECAELIKAVSKIERFGEFDWHPNHPDINNRTKLLEEKSDVDLAFKNYLQALYKRRN